MTNKQRKLEILNYKLKKAKELINNWKFYGVSEKKINKMERKKIKYENQIADIENS